MAEIFERILRSQSLVEAFGALEEGLPPAAVIEIPIDGRGDAFARGVERVPVELALREGGIDRVATVVAEAIGDERDQAVRLAKAIED